MMNDHRLQRIAAGAGILYFVALFSGFALDAKGDPDPALAPLGDVARFMIEHPDRTASRYLIALAALFFLWFATALRGRIRCQEGDDDSLSSVAWGAGLLTAGLMLVGNAGWLAADFRAVRGSDADDLAQLWALGLAPGILSAITSATLLVAAAFASLRSGVLGRPLGYAAAVIAGGLLIGSVEPQGENFLSPLWGMSYMLFQLWVLVVGITLTRRRGWVSLPRNLSHSSEAGEHASVGVDR